jgi:phosphatidylcholine synthase
LSSKDPSHSPLRRLLAWGVHLFTASGAVFGTLAILEIGRGEFHGAALLMLVALAIDSVDGMAARAVRVSEVLPSIDGRRLDDIVDYFNYVVVPALFLLALGALPHWGFVIPILLSSAYGFSQQDAKTDDAFFLGWPSYWNVVAIDAWLLETSAELTTTLVCVFALLVFVPLKYVYPSRTPLLWRTTNLGAALWVVVTALAVAMPEMARDHRLVEISLVYPVYYLVLSAWLADWFGLRGRS